MKKLVILLLVVGAVLSIYEASVRLALAHRENGLILLSAKNTASAASESGEVVAQLEKAIINNRTMQKRNISTVVVLGSTALIQLFAAGVILLGAKRDESKNERIQN